MLYGILIFLVLLLTFILFIELKSRKNIFPLAVAEKGNLISAVKSLALKSKSFEKAGYGIDISSIRKDITKGYRAISKKIRTKAEVYDFEKWLYENNYLLKKYICKSGLNEFKNLPHIKNQPRILALARLIVEGLNYNLEYDKVKELIDAYNSITVLTYKELCMLKKAIIIALIIKAAEISSRSSTFLKNKEDANSGKVIKSKLTSQSYLYYLLKYDKRFKEKAESLSSVNVDNLEYEFTAKLVEYCVIIKSVINSISATENIFNYGIEKFSVIDKKLEELTSYKQADSLTKNSYLEKISDLSLKTGVNELYFSKKLSEFSLLKGEDISKLLFIYTKQTKAFIKDDKNLPLKAPDKLKVFCFISLNIIFAVIPAVITGLFAKNIIVSVICGLLAFIAFLKPSECIVIRFSPKKQRMPIPKMDYTCVPDDAKTMVVVSELISDINSFNKALEHLKKLHSVNCGKNINYALLCDLKPSDKEIADDDTLILEKFKNLTLPDDFSFFVRKRIKGENCYCGYERKRGAIMNLADLLINGNNDNFIFVKNNMTNPSYLILLDADNQLLPGSVISAVNTISHPLNKDYDLLVFNGRYDLSSENTPYSRKFKNETGFENYNNYSDYYYGRFRKSIYCGKCIIRLKSMYDKLEGVLPDGRILSHDIIEGAIMNTGLLRDKVYEDAPDTFVSDMSRQKRWERGDIQLLPYVFNKVKNKNGDKIKNTISGFYKYIIFSNAVNVLSLSAVWLMLCIALYMSDWVIAVSAFVSVTLPFLIQIIDKTISIKNVRVRYVLKDLTEIFFEYLYKLFMLPFFALRGVSTFFVTLTRMLITKKNLLQWKTYSFFQGKNKFAKHFFMILPSVIINAVIAVFSMNLWAALYSFVFIVVSILIYFAGKKDCDNFTVSEGDKELLLETAQKTYRYFFDMYDGNSLICDNYQIKPMKGKRKATSPTNIGFSLLSEISACELGIISESVAIERIKKTIDTVLKLDKWKGHLFNWYNTETFEVLKPRFVSSVDSANFVAALITAKEFLRKKGQYEYYEIINRMINETDLSAMYDANTKLFRIGFNEDGGYYSGMYDLLASESRLLSYIFTAISKNTDNWTHLSRQCVSHLGNTLVSWSGTAFEYFMPELFLDTPKKSMLYNTMNNVLKLQYQKKCNGIFGIGESCYYKFDLNMNYQYRAFGLRVLSLRSEFDKCVISPYSSILALRYNSDKVIDNIKKLKECGMCGKYGFYESIDLSKGRNKIETYMAHHQGMILCAIANFLKRDCIKNYFNSDYAINSSKLILTEKQPVTRFGKNDKSDFVYEDEVERYSATYRGIKSFPRANILSNGLYSVVLDDSGCGYSCFDGIMLNVYENDEFQNFGSFIYLKDTESGRIITPTFAPIRENPNDFGCRFSDEEVLFENISENISMSVSVPPCFKGEVRKIKISNDSDKIKNFEIFFYTDIILSSEDEQYSHKVFKKMFIKTEKLKGGETVVAEKRSLDGLNSEFASLTVKSLENIEFETNRFNFLGRLKDEKSPEFLIKNEKKNTSFGDVLEPCFAFKGNLTVAPGGKSEFSIIMTGNNDKDKLYSDIAEACSENFDAYAEEAIKINSITQSGKFIKSLRAGRIKQYILTGMLYSRHEKEQLALYKDKRKMLKSVLGFDICKYVLFDYASRLDDGFVKELLGACEIIKKCIKNFQLVITYSEEEGYYKDIYKNLINLIEETGCNPEGITLINTKDLLSEEINAVNKCAFLEIHKDGEYLYPNIKGGKKDFSGAIEEREVRGRVEYPSAKGGFVDGGYEIDSIPLLPFSNVFCMEHGGSVVTENGGGYTYFENSRENKFSQWNNDPVKDYPSEQVVITEKNRVWRINKGYNKGKTLHMRGITNFYNNINGIYSRMSKYHIFDGKVAVYEVTVTNSSFEKRNIDLIFSFDAVLNWRKNDFVYLTGIGDILQAENILNGSKAFGRVFEGELITNIYNIKSRYHGSEVAYFDENKTYSKPSFAARYNVTMGKGNKKKFYFLISEDYNLINNITQEDIEKEKNITLNYFNNLNKVKIDTKNKGLDIIFNDWLMYQTISSRFNGRCGYYQAGGAYGFRDQLQDCLAMIYSDTEKVKKHILLCAAHQYEEGDVMHWWHPEKFGVRTRISDDKLFLPYVVVNYIKHTGDYSILEDKIEYLKSLPLNSNEHARLEIPETSTEKFTLTDHMLKALDNALKFGENDLLLIGAGDWNDGFDNIGKNGKGESIWLSMFCYEVINEILPYVSYDKKPYYIECATRLKKAVNKYFTGDRFIRCITDEGEILGQETSIVCKTDILTQSFSAFSDITDNEKRDIALGTAENLVDYDNGIVKLLDPPFKSNKFYGYISSYPEGVRENGGQYTHAAVWFIRALSKAGFSEKAYNILNLIIPFNKCLKSEDYEKYKGEPYVIAADVYTNKDNYGRMGWSWYTGSAAWLYKTILEDIIGIRIEQNYLIIEPKLPESIGSCSVEYKYKNAVYKIKIIKCGSAKTIIDRVEAPHGKIPLIDKNKVFNVEYRF